MLVWLYQSCQLLFPRSPGYFCSSILKGFWSFSGGFNRTNWTKWKMLFLVVTDVLGSDFFFYPPFPSGLSRCMSSDWHLEELHPWPRCPGVSYVTAAPSGWEAFPGSSDKRLMPILTHPSKLLWTLKKLKHTVHEKTRCWDMSDVMAR